MTHIIWQTSFLTIIPECDLIINPLIKNIPQKNAFPVATAWLLRQYLVIAHELSNQKEIDRAEKALVNMAISRWGKNAVWACSYILLESNTEIFKIYKRID